MGTYIIGDVHGCWRTLERLMSRIDYRAGRDRLIFVGDLVNGGPESARVVRWVREQGADVVLGNHDLHLLAVWAGVRAARSSDSFQDLLGAPDSFDLLEWLRRRPFLIRERDFVVTHAGLHPAWSLERAEEAAEGLTVALCGERFEKTMGEFFAGTTNESCEETLAFEADVFTRMRLVKSDGRLDLDSKGPPEKSPAGSVPWFEFPGRQSWTTRIYFGHWAALGLCLRPDVAGLDSGCVWGGRLTALRVEDNCVFAENSELSPRI